MMDSWYGWLERKDVMREYKYPVGNYGAREWHVGWIGIDGDTLIEHELSPVTEQDEDGEPNNNNAEAYERKARISHDRTPPMHLSLVLKISGWTSTTGHSPDSFIVSLLSYPLRRLRTAT